MSGHLLTQAIRDPVVVMVLSLGFIASVFLLQYLSLVATFTDELVSLQSLQRSGLVDITVPSLYGPLQ